MTDKFKDGDLVRHRGSNSPTMVVVHYPEEERPGMPFPMTHVSYFDSQGGHAVGYLADISLELVESETN